MAYKERKLTKGDIEALYSALGSEPEKAKKPSAKKPAKAKKTTGKKK